MSAHRPGSPVRRGYTLVELVAVMVIGAVLAAVAVPALGALRDTQSRGLADEIGRRMTLARGFAMTTGEPAGVVIDLAAQTVGLVRIAPGATAPTPMPGPTGDASAAARASTFGGSAIESFTNGDGATGSGAAWFDADGRPHLRTAQGAFLAMFTVDAEVVVRDGPTVTLRRLTGLVE